MCMLYVLNGIQVLGDPQSMLWMNVIFSTMQWSKLIIYEVYKLKESLSGCVGNIYWYAIYNAVVWFNFFLGI